MLIKFLVSLSGPEMSYHAGDTAEFEDEEAGRLIEAGIAIPFVPEPVKETRKKD